MANRTITLEMAVQRLREGNPEEASRIARKILKRDSANPAALHIAGLAAYQLGKPRDAKKSILKAVRVAPAYHEAHSNLGLVLGALGDSAGAEKSYRTALAMAPDNPDTHNNLGMALEEQGRLDEAAASYEKALELAPRYPAALFNLGNVRHGLGAPAAALEHYRQAAEIDPEFSQAWVNMAGVYRETGDDDKAAECYEKALTVNPDDVAALFGLGEHWESRDDHARAAGCYRRCLELEPDFALARNNLGMSCHALGLRREAEDCYRTAIESAPDMAEPLHNLARLQRENGDFGAAIGNLLEALSVEPGFPRAFYELATNFPEQCDEALLDHMKTSFRSDDVTDSDKWVIGFGLNNAIKKTGDAKQAFSHLLEANRLRRRSLPHDRAAERRRFDMRKQALSTVRPELTVERNDADWRPIFVLGMPRSGTTLVEQVLACHPNVTAAGEVDYLNGALNALQAETGRAFPAGFNSFQASDMRHVRRRYREDHGGQAAETLFVTDKMPHNFQYLAIIRHAFPDSPVIHVRRDPLDNCFSLFEASFTKGHGYCYDLEDLGHYYLMYADYMDHCAESAPGLVHEVSYERLIDDSESVIRDLLAHCGLEFDAACLRPHETERVVTTASSVQVRNPIHKASVKRWRAVEAELAPLIDVLGAGAY